MSEKLGIVKLMVGRILSSPMDSSEFGMLFQGLGKIKGEYHIKIDGTVKP